MQSEPRTFEHSNIPRWWIVVTLRDRSKKLTSGLEWTMTPYDDILTFALPHSWLYSLQFSSSGSHCCFPTCRHVLKREASSRHECLNKSFSISNSWAKHLLAEKKTALVTVSRLKSLAVERLNFLSVALCFHVPHLARKHRKSCKWQGKAQRSQFRSPTLCSHLEQTSRNRVPNWEDSIRKWCSTPHKAHSPCLWSVLRCPYDPLLLSLQFFL